MVHMTDSTSSSNQASPRRGPEAEASLVWAWVSVALVPAFFFVSFAVQTGLYSLTGYDPSTGTPPLWANLAAGLPGLAIVLAPCVASIVYGRRALRAGVRTGLVPLVLAVLVGLGAVVLTVVNL